MTCYGGYYVLQDLYTYPYFEQNVWDDCALDAPKLSFPPDAITYCGASPDGVPTFDYVFSWLPVSGAVFYVLQISQNSNFEGPDIYTRIVYAPSVQYTYSGGYFSQGQQYYWRVFAVDNSSTFGCHSPSSVVRTFTVNCVQQFTGGQGPSQPDSDTDKCDLFNVTVDIVGPEEAECCDCTQYWAYVAYNCISPFYSGGNLISVNQLVWNLRDNPGQAKRVALVPSAVQAGESVFICPPRDGMSQELILDLCVEFTDHINGGTFVCCAHKNITIECEGPETTKTKTVSPLVSVDAPGLINPAGYAPYPLFPPDEESSPYAEGPFGDAPHRSNMFNTINRTSNCAGTELACVAPAAGKPVAILSAPIIFDPEPVAAVDAAQIQVGVDVDVTDEEEFDPDEVGADVHNACKKTTQGTGGHSDNADIPGQMLVQGFARVPLPLGCGLLIEDDRVIWDVDSIRAGTNITVAPFDDFTGCGVEISATGEIDFDAFFYYFNNYFNNYYLDIFIDYIVNYINVTVLPYLITYLTTYIDIYIDTNIEQYIQNYLAGHPCYCDSYGGICSGDDLTGPGFLFIDEDGNCSLVGTTSCEDPPLVISVWPEVWAANSLFV